MKPTLVYPLVILAIVLIFAMLALFKIPLSNKQDMDFTSLPQSTPPTSQIDPIDKPNTFSGLTLPVPPPDSATPTPTPPDPEFPISELEMSTTPTPSIKLDFGDMVLPTPTPTPGINTLTPPGQ